MGSGRVQALILVVGVALSPCQAREMAKTPAGEGARPCPEYGGGFVRVPGGSTCLRLSGRVRADTRLRSDKAVAAPMAAGRLAIDTRTESDLGPIRTFVRIGDGRR